MINLEERELRIKENYSKKMMELEDRKTACLEKKTEAKVNFFEKKLSLLDVNASLDLPTADVLEIACQQQKQK